MYIRSYDAGFGRNFSTALQDGELIVRSKLRRDRTKERYKIEGGLVTESLLYERNRKIHTRHGQFRKVYDRGKLVEENYFSYEGRMRYKGLFFRKVGKDYILERYSSGGSMAREIVYWKNGQLMYNLGKGNRNVRIYNTHGAPGVHIKLSAGFPLYSHRWNLHLNMPEITKLTATFRGKWYYELYDEKGDIRSWIMGEGNNPEKGSINGNPMYFLRGIHVPKKVITEDYDAGYILAYPNVTVRSEMMKKYGVERIIQELKGEIIDKNDEYELLKLPVPGGRVPDNVMKVLKMRCPSLGVWYALRVPPQSENITEALNWTYGLNIFDIRKDKKVDIVRAT